MSYIYVKAMPNYIPITTSLVGYYMAENLPENITVTVLTNSVTIAEVLRKKINISVILLGGEMSTMGHFSAQ